jgi:hypothetical protein
MYAELKGYGSLNSGVACSNAVQGMDYELCPCFVKAQ